MDLEVEEFTPSHKQVLLKSAALVFARIQSDDGSHCSVDARKRIWPAYSLDGYEPNPRLRIVPLVRIGASEGKSGARVVVGFFEDMDRELAPSKPMVIKLGSGMNVRKDEDDKVYKERKNADAVAPFALYNSDNFALPLHYNCIEADELWYSVLWSPYSLSRWTHKSEDLPLASDFQDLWTQLQSDSQGSDWLDPKLANELLAVLDTVYDLMLPFHDRALRPRTCRTAPYKEVFAWYMRGFDEPTSGRSWSNSWHSEWRDDFVRELGVEFPNPITVLKKVLDMTVSYSSAAVHGDLHPKNIVMSVDGIPNIIDFGWACGHGHASMDFTLLEANMRFVVMPSNIPTDDILKLAMTIDNPSDASSFRDPRANLRQVLLERIRQKALRACPGMQEDPVRQYLIPLFIVSFGLLRHIDSFSNQLSARLTVLSCAKHLNRKLELGLDGGND